MYIYIESLDLARCSHGSAMCVLAGMSPRGPARETAPRPPTLLQARKPRSSLAPEAEGAA